MGAEDDVEMPLEADDLDRALDEAQRRVGDQADRRPPLAQALEQLAGADHRLHAVLELGDDQRVQLLDQPRRPAGLPQPLFQHPAGDLGRGADQHPLVGRGELGPAPLEEVFLGPGPDRLGVEQEAVVVEDDRVGVAAHQPSAAISASSSASTSPPSFTSASPSYGVSPLVTIASRPPWPRVSRGSPATGCTASEEPTQSIRSAPSASSVARSIASSGSISPKRTTSGLTAPPHSAQSATPRASKRASIRSSPKDAPQSVQEEDSIDPCTSITFSEPAARCRRSMFWVITPSIRPCRSSSASAACARLGSLSASDSNRGR